MTVYFHTPRLSCLSLQVAAVFSPALHSLSKEVRVERMMPPGPGGPGGPGGPMKPLPPPPPMGSRKTRMCEMK